MLTNKKWILPKMDRLTEVDWKPVIRVRNNGRAPFGYEVSPHDPSVLLPIAEELDALKVAKDLYKEYTLKEVAAWLSEHTGRPISPQVLRRRIKDEEKRQKEYSQLLFWEKKAKEAVEKLKKLESKPGEHLNEKW